MAALIQSMRATQVAVKFAQVYTLEDVENLYDAFDDVAQAKGDTKTLHKSDFVSVLTDVLKLQTTDETTMATGHWEAFAVEPMANTPAVGWSCRDDGSDSQLPRIHSCSVNDVCEKPRREAQVCV